MSLDYATLDILRRQHPAWRLLLAEHAALIASFLHKTFVSPNVRMKSAADLAEALEDELFGLRQQLGSDTFPRTAMEYLNDWTANEAAFDEEAAIQNKPNETHVAFDEGRKAHAALLDEITKSPTASISPAVPAKSSSAAKREP